MDMRIKDLMIPISEYVTVGIEDTLYECFKALEDDKIAKGGNTHAHRDALVFNVEGDVVGKVTMQDIFLALEPGYKSLKESLSDSSVLTPEYLAQVYKDFDLWTEPLKNICPRAAALKVDDMMHAPEEAEFVGENDPLGLALHRYVMNVHQPLLVRGEGGKITGVLRFGDVFKQIKNMTLACEI